MVDTLYVICNYYCSCLLSQFSACNCNKDGSTGSSCDDNGVCSCKPNFINDKCDECADGYFHFPRCESKSTVPGILTGCAILINFANLFTPPTMYLPMQFT